MGYFDRAIPTKDEYWKRPGFKGEAAKAWYKLREKVVGKSELDEQEYLSKYRSPDESFRQATETLAERAKTHAGDKAALEDWVKAQEIVLANFESRGKGPAVPAPLESGPADLRADRAYQIAAAHFNARQLDQAIAEFDKIAADAQSPHRKLAAYLSLRTRFEALRGKEQAPENAERSAALLKEAEALRAKPEFASLSLPLYHLVGAIQATWMAPERLKQLGEQLAAGKAPDFEQDFRDYSMISNRGNVTATAAPDEMSAWIRAFKSGDWAASRAGLEGAQPSSRALWLVAALASAPAGAPETAALVAEARKLKRDHPAWLSARYFAARALTNDGYNLARETLKLASRRDALSRSSFGDRNRLRLLSAKFAPSVEQFAALIPKEAEIGYEGAGFGLPDPTLTRSFKSHYGVSWLIDPETQQQLNLATPLTGWLKIAQSVEIQPYLLKELASVGFTRAILLKRMNEAREFAKILVAKAPELKSQAEAFLAAPDDDARQREALVMIVSSPGMRPIYHNGPLRIPGYATGAKTQWGNLKTINGYADRYWGFVTEGYIGGCGSATLYGNSLKALAWQPPFWTEDEKKQGQAEWDQLLHSGAASDYFLKGALAWAKDPELSKDPRVPEVLSRAVHSEKNCHATDRKLGIEAFKLLKSRYKDSEWAAKTKIHY